MSKSRENNMVQSNSCWTAQKSVANPDNVQILNSEPTCRYRTKAEKNKKFLRALCQTAIQEMTVTKFGEETTEVNQFRPNTVLIH